MNAKLSEKSSGGQAADADDSGGGGRNRGNKSEVELLQEQVDRAKEDVLRAEKQLKETGKLPGTLVAAFGCNLIVKVVPHMILVALFLSRAGGTNGVAFYLLVALLADLFVSLKVLASWIYYEHPSLFLLSSLYVPGVFVHWLGWGFEINPLPSSSALKFVTIVVNIVSTIVICPGLIMYARWHLAAVIQRRRDKHLASDQLCTPLPPQSVSSR